MNIDLRIGKLTDIGKSRKHNEDNFCVVENDTNGVLLVVADGMGGMGGGDIASMLAVKTVEENFKNSKSNDNVENLLDALIMTANSAVYSRSHKDGQRISKMGSTLVLLLISGNKAYISHAGDSRCYWMDNGKIKKMTVDHSGAQELVNLGIIKEENMLDHPDSSILTRSIGTKEKVKPETMKDPVTIKNGDAFILCSDGLYQLVTDEEIAQIVYKNDDPDSACRELVDLANERGGTDNITVIIAKYGKTKKPKRRNISKMPNKQNNEDSKLKKNAIISNIAGLLILCLLVVLLFMLVTHYGNKKDIESKPEDITSQEAQVIQEEITAPESEEPRDEKREPREFSIKDVKFSIVYVPAKDTGENIKGFWMMNTPVTQELYKAVMGDTEPSVMNYDIGNENNKHPVTMVKWDDAVEFCNKLNKQRELLSLNYNEKWDLPTKEEWKHAAYYNKDKSEIFDYGWFKNNSKENKTNPVAQKKHNYFGLYDIYGNVWEWSKTTKEGEDEIKIIITGGSFFSELDSGDGEDMDKPLIELLTKEKKNTEHPDVGFRVILRRLDNEE